MALIGLLAVGLLVGAVAVTGLNLVRGGLLAQSARVLAEFSTCGQGIRVGGDVKLRGVLVGRISEIRRGEEGVCRVELGLFPDELDMIPANAGAQIRAKTVFGEKWVELLLPDVESDERIARDDVITTDRTIEPIEVETILVTALPLLEAIDPEHLSGALTALADGFAGHEEAAIRGIDSGIKALQPLNRNARLLEEGIRQLAEFGKVFNELDEDLLAALENLDRVNRFTVDNSALIAENFDKTPELLRELSTLFQVRFLDLTKLVDRGATVIGVLAARADDLDRLLNVLPVFNSNWIRNLGHVCRLRQVTDAGAQGDEVPGRCWRVHNLISESRGAYEPGERPKPESQRVTDDDYHRLGLIDLTDIAKLLYLPAIGGAL